MSQSPHSQSGAVLIVSLMMLLVMTVIGVAGMQTGALEEKMAGNFRDKDLAIQTAEAALRDGEDIAKTKAAEGSGNNGFPSPATADDDSSCPDGENNNCDDEGLCATPDKDCPARWEDSGFTGWTNAPDAVNPDGLSTTPQYFIEYLGATFACTKASNACANGPGSTNCNCRRYRITSRIPTSGSRAKVMLQSVYATE